MQKSPSMAQTDDQGQAGPYQFPMTACFEPEQLDLAQVDSCLSLLICDFWFGLGQGHSKISI